MTSGDILYAQKKSAASRNISKSNPSSERKLRCSNVGETKKKESSDTFIYAIHLACGRLVVLRKRRKLKIVSFEEGHGEKKMRLYIQNIQKSSEICLFNHWFFRFSRKFRLIENISKPRYIILQWLNTNENHLYQTKNYINCKTRFNYILAFSKLQFARDVLLFKSFFF